MTEPVKTFVTDIIPSFFMRLVKTTLRGKYAAKDQMDKKMERYINYDRGYYVELGANNGIKESNTFYFERYRNWKGVLIEPSPNKFIECKANRSESNVFFCNACVSFDYREEFVKIIYSNLMSVPVNVESDITDAMQHATKGRKYLPASETMFEFGAKANTLTSLLQTANAPALIDFLSLDVEGAELEVLKGIDHEKYRFKYMLVECRNFDKLQHYLQQHDYRFVEALSYHDYLFSSANAV